MKIAIVGAGLSGVGACFYLSRMPGFKITLFDQNGIAGGASGVAVGLLHPFVGPDAKLNWRGREGYRASLELLKEASKNQKVFKETGLLRLALSDRQKKAFELAADSFEDVDWFSENAIFISSATTVDCRLYLEELWKKCACPLVKKRVHLSELNDFDAVILACGAALSDFLKIKLQLIKGQVLRLSWPENIPPFDYPVSSKKYIVRHEDKRSCWVGATYEKQFDSEDVNCDKAVSEIMPEAIKIVPALKNSKVLDCRAAVRVYTPERRPLVKQIDERVWILTGLGSKGLLYHALMGEQLAKELDTSLSYS